MSPDFPRRPKTVKGAIMALRSDSTQVSFDPNTPSLIFQYNPETLTRTFSPPGDEEASPNGKKRDANSISELISLTLEFDAVDQLEQPEKNRDVVENGLHPALAVLESIMHSQFKTGNPPPPILIFLFGRNRTVPVWLDSLKVIEEVFDPDLNPIRVRIELVMRVRDLSGFKKGSIGYAICASHLERRRTLSRLYPQNGSMHRLFDQVMRGIH